MKKPFITQLILPLLAASALFASSNITPENASAWSSSFGWIDFGSDQGEVTVYSTHIEGYAYSPNIGLIRLGTHSGGGEHIYQNSSNTNYGVNNDGSGNLSGYAWSPVIGWIAFSPDNSGVVIDHETGVFSGFAYNENTGLISFSGTAGDQSDYGIVTQWRGENVSVIDEGVVRAPGVAPGIYPVQNPVSLYSDRAEFVVVTDGPSDIQVVIYDSQGKMVDEQEFTTRTRGEPHRFSWDLRDKSGRAVTSGSYLAVAVVRSQRESTVKRYRTMVGVYK